MSSHLLSLARWQARGPMVGVIVVADRSRTAWFGVLPSRPVVAIAQD